MVPGAGPFGEDRTKHSRSPLAPGITRVRRKVVMIFRQLKSTTVLDCADHSKAHDGLLARIIHGRPTEKSGVGIGAAPTFYRDLP